MTEVLAVAVITVLAVIAPGADFAMVVRNSYLHGRRTGLLGALGVAAGVLVHVTYTMLGVGLLIASSTFLFTVIKLVGAAYLVYIGVRTFRTRGEVTVDLENKSELTPVAALRTGFLTNVLNPKTTLFVVSTFAQVVSPGTPVLQQVGYGLFMSLAHLLWFGVVAVFFSHDRMRTLMLRGQKILNKVIGSVLAGLGVSLAFAPSH
ncbi:LysE family translocator [Streptomyces griseoloalbus]|uniref:RhtB (Resistance to homoserine/threonine) family protein n=1 Tax=Streptomyces griseoloalbus TaxID=67303 RepID=A0A7W8BUN6_9ACTN|nr:LysE family transporter [Streptomyces albaduncus]MBB5129952.1 RhtB (resistance to homoserine/threonine) family protein [Streptomyces albaduncus]GGW75323.1 lysine transporter LysE [Streptomyces albaduncus]